MIGSINSFGNVNSVSPIRQEALNGVQNNVMTNPVAYNNYPNISHGTLTPTYQTNIRTTLISGDETQMYSAILTALNSVNNEQGEITVQQKFDELLRNGKLLNNSSNDGSTTLKNLYDIISTPRVEGFNSAEILKMAIDAIYKPSTITQTFGDVPDNVKEIIMGSPEISDEIKQNPELLNVKENGSGTCPAASLEFHLANKRPAEFARWASELTSPKMSVTQNIRMDSLSKNYLDSVWFLQAFETKPVYVDFEHATLELKPDNNAYTRASIQNVFYDKGERNVLDVLMQSTFMQNATQQSYDSLTDIRAGKFNSNPQGLSSDEKTFIESIVDNKEKLSIVYQNIDEEQHLIGYKCDFNKIENHIKSAIDLGEDVIIGFVFTDNDNKITGGHEITITDYRVDEKGETVFICNDTDDNNDELIEYKASYLLPKIHHAGYPAHLVEGEKELLEV